MVRKQTKQLKKIKQIEWFGDATIFVLILGAAFSFYKSQQVSNYSVETSEPYIEKTQAEEMKPYMIASSNEYSKKLEAEYLKEIEHKRYSNNESISDSLKRVDLLFKCIETLACEDFSSEQDRVDVYTNSVAIEVKDELYRLSDDEDVSQAELEEYVKSKMIGANDHIKEAAIYILSKSAESNENLELILGALDESSSGPLFNQGMDALKAYRNKSDNSFKIDRVLVQKLKERGLSTSIEISKNIFEFINAQNYGTYKSLLRSMSASSRPYENLSANLKEFQRMKNGG